MKNLPHIFLKNNQNMFFRQNFLIWPPTWKISFIKPYKDIQTRMCGKQTNLTKVTVRKTE